jgi:hypothetical protein
VYPVPPPPTPPHPHPPYPWHFVAHLAHQDACDKHDPNLHRTLKANADEYFTLKHRQQRRGVGGTFFHAMGDASLVGAEAGPGQTVADPFQFIKDSTVRGARAVGSPVRVGAGKGRMYWSVLAGWEKWEEGGCSPRGDGAAPLHPWCTAAAHGRVHE